MDADESHGSASYAEDDAPFFADMTLDLAEAHDIAETPEPTTRKRYIGPGDLGDNFPQMPVVPDSPQDLTKDTQIKALPISFMDDDDEKINPDFDLKGNLTSITSEQTHGRAKATSRSTMPSSKNWPRDVSWAVGFGIAIPFTLLWPILFLKKKGGQSDDSEYWMATAVAPRLATMHALLWALVASLILCRLLYRTIGGGDGDDARHIASQVLLASAPISVSVYIALILAIHFLIPRAWPYMIIPLWFLSKDIYLFRRWKMTSTTPGGRQAFFQALACMALDILSRSLRRSSFYRIVTALILFQFVVIVWWRMALLAALQSQSLFWIFMTFIGGKWATSTVARLLSLIASGGISSWFEEQNTMVEEMQQIKKEESENGEVETIEFMSSFDNKGDDESMPEAYRMTEASAYQTLALDEGMDDDFEDEDEEAALQPLGVILPISSSASTVKQLLLSGLTISFGSVAKCGLLGGLAQFIWSQVRKIDTARETLNGFRGMTIGDIDGTDEDGIRHFLRKSNRKARAFIRNYSDMAMSHVAAFQKPYNRAAQDVALLIDESGVEPIIHDDISTHISTCVGGSISGAIVIFTGLVLVHQRNRNVPQVSDSAVFMDMFLAFVFCYTLIFTTMEPLRASIKAVYVSFAQQPQSISQSFPLIFHRLSRMSQSNLQ